MTTQQISGGIVWPEDNGTNSTISADAGDYTSAGHLGSMAMSSGTGYVEAGVSLSYNPADPSVDIGAGLAFVEYAGASTVQDNTGTYGTTWDHPLVMLVSVPAVANLTLDAAAVNDLYLAIDTTTQNSARYVFGSAVAEPTDPHIKIGEIDTSTDAVTELGRAPSATFSDVAANSVTVSNGIDFAGSDATNLDHVGITPDSEVIANVVDSSPPADPLPFTVLFDGRDFRFYSAANGHVSLFIGADGSVNVPSGGMSVSGDVQGSNVNATSTVSAGTDVSTPALSGGVTGGITLSSLVGDNLSISSGTLNSTDTQNTTTTLHMSDYAPGGGVCDTEFDTAVSEASPGDTIVFDHGNYELATAGRVITKPLHITSTGDSIVSMTDTTTTAAHIEFAGGGTGASTTTTAALSPGENTIPVTDSSAFAAGDTILIMDDAYGTTVDSTIQFMEVESVSSATTIQTFGTTSRSFVSGANVYVADMLDAPKISNISTDGGGYRHFQFSWCLDPEYRDVSISEYQEVSLISRDCWRPSWHNVTAKDPTSLASGHGEPVASYRDSEPYMENVHVYDCRRGIDFAWGTHDATVVHPVIHNADIGGITVHGGDHCGHISIQGGVISCKPDGTIGNCIVNTQYAPMEIDGTHLIARRAGIQALGPVNATNLYIEPVVSPYEGQGIWILHSDVSITNTQIVDPDNEFGEAVNIDTTEGRSLSNITVDADIIHNSTNAYLINTTGAGGFTIDNVNLRGSISTTGTSQVIHIFAEDGMIIDVDISVDVTGPPVDQVIRLGGAGGVDNINLHDCHMVSASKAVIYDRDSLGASGSVHIHDCKFESGATTLSFNGTSGNTVSQDALYVSDCEVPGSIDHSGVTNYYKEGSLIVAEGSVALSSGSAQISTGVEQPIDVHLDPSDGGANSVDIDVVASAYYDSSASEMVVEITEDSTAVGNPTVGYRVIAGV